MYGGAFYGETYYAGIIAGIGGAGPPITEIIASDKLVLESAASSLRERSSVATKVRGTIAVADR